MTEENRKQISETLYLGLLFAQEDAGGTLIPGNMHRDRSVSATADALFQGLKQCGCIMGAAALAGGPECGDRWREDLVNIGLTANMFDALADRHPITVDATLAAFGVDVVPDEQLLQLASQARTRAEGK